MSSPNPLPVITTFIRVTIDGFSYCGNVELYPDLLYNNIPNIPLQQHYPVVDIQPTASTSAPQPATSPEATLEEMKEDTKDEDRKRKEREKKAKQRAKKRLERVDRYEKIFSKAKK